jgi:hypothetical protein
MTDGKVEPKLGIPSPCNAGGDRTVILEQQKNVSARHLRCANIQSRAGNGDILEQARRIAPRRANLRAQVHRPPTVIPRPRSA